MPTLLRRRFIGYFGSRMFSPSSSTWPLASLLRVQRVDAVEHAQQGRLAAAGRADQRGHALLRDLEVDVLDRVELAVPEVQVARGELHRRGGVGTGGIAQARRRRGVQGIMASVMGHRGNLVAQQDGARE
jgi:hypothetical protein